MQNATRHAKGHRPGLATLILAGTVVAGCAAMEEAPPAAPAAPAAAEAVPEFTLAVGPPWNCSPALQSQAQASNCAAAIIINKDGSLNTCPCDQHGANYSTQSLAGWTVTHESPLNIMKLVPPSHGGTDPCTTYTIGGVPQKVCW